MSRRFVAATERQMDAWLARDLSALELAVLMIDAVHVEDHVLLVAIGIDRAGTKHVLGVREGATENATACTALLTDIVERGAATDKAILAVLDGAKALAKAVRNVWGNRALIQRCQVHKLRNVLDHLPEVARAAAKKAMQKACRSSNAKEAKNLLQALHRKLADEHPGAAGSLDEGLDETLTVKRFGLPEWLERTLSTTNAAGRKANPAVPSATLRDCEVIGCIRAALGRVSFPKPEGGTVKVTYPLVLSPG